MIKALEIERVGHQSMKQSSVITATTLPLLTPSPLDLAMMPGALKTLA